MLFDVCGICVFNLNKMLQMVSIRGHSLSHKSGGHLPWGDIAAKAKLLGGSIISEIIRLPEGRCFLRSTRGRGSIRHVG